MDIEKEHDSNKKELEFQSYVPAEQTPPELTVTSVMIGVLLAVVFGAATLTLDYVWE